MKMSNINYFQTIASPMEPLLEAIMNSSSKVEFTCKELKNTLLRAKDNDAYYLDANGNKRMVPKKISLNSVYVNYLLTVYLAKENIKEESFKKVMTMIDYTVMVHQKLYEVVDPSKTAEFISSFNSLLSIISLEVDEEIKELILAYIRINQGKPMFD